MVGFDKKSWRKNRGESGKIQDKNLNILKTKRAFQVKQKVFFITFKGLSVAKNCLRPESAPLRPIFKKKTKKKNSETFKPHQGAALDLLGGSQRPPDPQLN